MIDLKPLSSSGATLGKRTREQLAVKADEEEYWTEVEPAAPETKKKRRPRKRKAVPVEEEEEEDAEMLDADVTLELSMLDAYEEPVKPKKKPCSRKEPVQK